MQTKNRITTYAPLTFLTLTFLAVGDASALIPFRRATNVNVQTPGAAVNVSASRGGIFRAPRVNVAVATPVVAVGAVGVSANVRRVGVGHVGFRTFGTHHGYAQRAVVFRSFGTVGYGTANYAGALASYSYAAPPSATYAVPSPVPPAPTYAIPAPAAAPAPVCDTCETPAPAPTPPPTYAPSYTPAPTYTPAPSYSYGCCGGCVGGGMTYAPAPAVYSAPAPAVCAPALAPAAVSYAPAYTPSYGVSYSPGVAYYSRAFAPGFATYNRSFAFSSAYRFPVFRGVVRVGTFPVRAVGRVFFHRHH